jgi:hypothetical protein
MRITLLSLLLAAFLSAAEKNTFTTNDHVKVEMLSPSKISSTKNGVIKLFLSPTDGIHINTEPMFELKLEKDSHFELAGEPRFTKNEKEYLDTNKPVEFTIKVKNGVQPGKHLLKAKFYYFYCSDKEGWCNRFTQPIDLTITVTK